MKFIYTILVLMTFASCQKAIKVDLPSVDQDYVVEGRIETGLPPLIILSKTQGYFDVASAESIFSTFVHGANMTITNNGNVYPLIELCTNSIPDSLLDELSQLTGIPEENLAFFDYCVYTTLDFAAFGAEGQYYELNIEIDGNYLSSTTSIPVSVPLDSLWFKPVQSLDSLGFIWTNLSDPGNTANFYRWYAQRTNRHTFGPEIGTVKDPFFIAPLGSVFDDKFFNGLSFEFSYARGEVGQLEGQDDEGPEEGYFKSGDTIVVKFCSINRENFLYLRSLENQAASAGSPFASPGNMPFNIKGGLGIWAGYAPFYDTLICQ